MYFKPFIKPFCLLCTALHSNFFGLCDGCINDLPWHNAPQCPQCGLLSNGLTCGNCLHAIPHFDATHALFTYDYPINGLLQHYKYREMIHLAHTFSGLLHQRKLSTFIQNIDVIIPMPMHHQRLKERGFNQALELARLLSRKMGITLDYKNCQRIKLTPPQANLALKERTRNIRGVFECKKNFQGQRIALVDDVMTTGASLNELAKTLKNSGAAHVECWVIARTLPK